MGYDIIGYRTKTSGEVLAHVSCPYAWESHFKRVLGRQPQELNGRILKDDRFFWVQDFTRMLGAVKECEIQQWRGNLPNCSKEVLILDFEELILNVENGKIRYVTLM